MAKNYYEDVTRTIDKDTGEVVEIQQRVKRRVERDKFAMIYLKDISSILDLGTKGEYKVLLALLPRSNYNTNEVRIMKDVKTDIAKETNLSLNSVNKAVKNLNSKEIIIRKKHEGEEIRGVYILNPTYFFKGEDMERAKVFKMVLEYEITD